MIARHYHQPTGQWARPHSRSYSTLVSPSFYAILEEGSKGNCIWSDIKTLNRKSLKSFKSSLRNRSTSNQPPRPQMELQYFDYYVLRPPPARRQGRLSLKSRGEFSISLSFNTTLSLTAMVVTVINL